MKTLYELIPEDASRMARQAERNGAFLSGHSPEGRSAIVSDGQADVELRGEALIEFLYAVKQRLERHVLEVRQRLSAHGVPCPSGLTDADRVDLLVARTLRGDG